MQQDTKALQVSRVPPRKLHTPGETVDCIGLSLTLPKLYLASLKSQLTYNTVTTTHVHINHMYVQVHVS